MNFNFFEDDRAGDSETDSDLDRESEAEVYCIPCRKLGKKVNIKKLMQILFIYYGYKKMITSYFLYFKNKRYG